MPRATLIALGAAAVLFAVSGAAARAGIRPARAAGSASAMRAVASHRRVRDLDVEFYRRRVAADPSGAIDRVRLGGLYLERYRDTGEEPDLTAAEEAARGSLANRAERNDAAWQLLTGALLGQHRFVEARGAAERFLALDPEDGFRRAVLGEVLLELGEYQRADALFGQLAPVRYSPAIAPRYARWLELRGHAGQARRLLEWARDQAAREDATTPQQLSWYELRLGELALRFGALAEARRRLDAGLALVPDDWHLLAARARLALARGDYASAVSLGDSSLARHLDPATLAAVGDAWRARGDSAQAMEYYHAMEVSTRAPRGGFHRAWYLALLDHGRRVPEVLAAVSKDLETRRDVYGYDLLAWALYRSGRIPEAREAIAHALAWGTEDPQLHAHADSIAAAP
jgi:tetratricopeptide (TPR) repeat protein